MVPSSGFEPLKLAQRCLRPSPLTWLGKDGEKNSFTSFRRLMVLDWIPTYLHIGERASTVLISGASPIKESNQWPLARSVFITLTTKGVRVSRTPDQTNCNRSLYRWAMAPQPPARVELARPFNRTPPGRGEKNSSCELVRDPVNLIWTGGLEIYSLPLYQLSYDGVPSAGFEPAHANIVELESTPLDRSGKMATLGTGVEPVASRLTVARSDQLS